MSRDDFDFTSVECNAMYIGYPPELSQIHGLEITKEF
jgi:hypothetical protein